MELDQREVQKILGRWHCRCLPLDSFRNLPRDLRGTSLSPDGPYTLDLFVRYGYLIWMMLYFFTSADITYITLENKKHPNKDLVFGIVQSIFALSSQYWLGFVKMPPQQNLWVDSGSGSRPSV
jgi:hypothetical protein